MIQDLHSLTKAEREFIYVSTIKRFIQREFSMQKLLDGREGERKREKGIESERETCRVSCSVMAWYIVQLHALGGLAELNVIYRRDRSFERWTVCFESPGKLLDTWQLRLLWARPEAKLTSARTGKDKVVKRYDSLLSCLSTTRDAQ